MFRCQTDGGSRRNSLWWPAHSEHWLSCTRIWQYLLSMIRLMYVIPFLHWSASLEYFRPRTKLGIINRRIPGLATDSFLRYLGPCMNHLHPVSQQVGVHEAPLCVDVERTVCFPCVWLWLIIWVHIGSVCVYFEFTLLSSTWWTKNDFISAHWEHKNSWTHASTDLLGRWSTCRFVSK